MQERPENLQRLAALLGAVNAELALLGLRRLRRRAAPLLDLCYQAADRELRRRAAPPQPRQRPPVADAALWYRARGTCRPGGTPRRYHRWAAPSTAQGFGVMACGQRLRLALGPVLAPPVGALVCQRCQAKTKAP